MTTLGVGGASLFGSGAPTRTEEEMCSALDAALEGGVSLLDLAPSYGHGAVEEFVGQWIASRQVRDRVVVVTKVSAATRKSLASTRRWVTDSLQRLQTEYVDVVFVHSWSQENGSLEAKLEDLESLVSEGIVRDVGVSAKDSCPSDLVPYVREGMVHSLQMSYNVFDQSIGEALLASCAEREVRVLGRAPFFHGALTGLLSELDHFPPTDPRSMAFGAPLRSIINRRVAAFDEVCARLSLPPHEVALRFAATDERIDTIVVGMRTVRHVDANLAALAGGNLPADAIELLRPLDWSDRFGEAPTRPV